MSGVSFPQTATSTNPNRFECLLFARYADLFRFSIDSYRISRCTNSHKISLLNVFACSHKESIPKRPKYIFNVCQHNIYGPSVFCMCQLENNWFLKMRLFSEVKYHCEDTASASTHTHCVCPGRPMVDILCNLCLNQSGHYSLCFGHGRARVSGI